MTNTFSHEVTFINSMVHKVGHSVFAGIITVSRVLVRQTAQGTLWSCVPTIRFSYSVPYTHKHILELHCDTGVCIVDLMACRGSYSSSSTMAIFTESHLFKQDKSLHGSKLVVIFKVESILIYISSFIPLGQS